MPKLYEVEIIVRAVIVADDMNHALRVGRSERSAIVRDSDLECDVVGEIQSTKDLPDGWDEQCLPFGANDDRPIADYLDNLPPERDTKTIDMFAPVQSRTQGESGGEA